MGTDTLLTAPGGYLSVDFLVCPRGGLITDNVDDVEAGPHFKPFV
jgi:hypothetical protein